MTQSELLNELIQRSEQIQQEASQIQQLSDQKLIQRPNSKSWNALECFEHLNLYIELYNGFFQNALKKAKQRTVDNEIKRGYWGNRFIQWMQPTEQGIKKMNTFSSKNPINQPLDKGCIDRFLKGNQITIELLQQAQSKEIQKTSCQLAIPILKLKLSDAFHFLIAHNQRHMVQIKNAIQ